MMSAVATLKPNREVEIKLKLPSADEARQLLRKAGLRVSSRRVFEDNTVFDTPDLSLRRNGTLLRIREAGPVATLTYKGAAEPGRHKSREELEVSISNAKEAALILSRLGFLSVFRYQKFRTEYTAPRAGGVVTLDETPIGCFLEIEGAPRWIDRAARRLGFSEADYVTASYGRLYLDLRRRNADLPADMVFADAST